MAPTVLCVGGVPKQNKTKWRSKQKSKTNSKCCRVPLVSGLQFILCRVVLCIQKTSVTVIVLLLFEVPFHYSGAAERSKKWGGGGGGAEAGGRDEWGGRCV